MSLRVYNTLKGQKEPFEPLEPGKVRMYVCGVTVYDFCHIGHARANVVFDVIYRYLKYRGYDVTYVRNYTDVDDKIIQRAQQQHCPSEQIAETYIQAFDEDMQTLGLEKPTIEPKATEHIDAIIRLVQDLEAKGFAYAVDGDVYFSVAAYPEYLRLSGRNLEEMRAGARIEPGEKKRDPMDFALWKAAKPGEPAWNSPWGQGRPGWHIECSAMSMAYLGHSFDIHGGGKDLIFPHHENEIAQSEAASGQPFVKYWLHNGFVNINQEKMSKSLGNFFTIRDILQNYTPEVIRFFILSAHYRSPLDFSDTNLEEARRGLERCYEALQSADRLLAELGMPEDGSQVPQQQEQQEIDQLQALEQRFQEAMDDDFNTAQALGQLFTGVRALNALASSKQKRLKQCPALLQGMAAGVAHMRRIGQVLGVLQQDPATWLHHTRSLACRRLGLKEDDIKQKLQQRQQARQAKDFAQADALRDELASQGIEVLDYPGGSDWKVK